jgi:hypothetical protein
MIARCGDASWTTVEAAAAPDWRATVEVPAASHRPQAMIGSACLTVTGIRAPF